MGRGEREPGTLVRPPPLDPSKAQIENVLELTPLVDIGPDIFTNTRPLWRPPGARGIYGGSAIAQCLAAAQLTIPPPCAANGNATFFPHSMHCYFVLAGDSEIPVLYHVERVRGGKSFITRTVQARQKGKCIFTTTISFVREGSAGEETVGHEAGLPEGVEDAVKDDRGDRTGGEYVGGGGPFEARRLETLNQRGSPHDKRTRQWIRCRGTLSPAAGTQGHLSALAYMTDSYFIGTIARVHNLWRFGRPSSRPSTTVSANHTKPTPKPKPKPKPLPATPARPNPHKPHDTHKEMAAIEEKENAESGAAEEDEGRVIGMMVSLDHSIYFHKPRAIRADEWLFAEMDSPWAGDGRGLVFQKIWNRGGELVATCVQEGVVRLVQGREKVKL